MALVFNRDSINIKNIGEAVTVPNHPKARLMYYLDCMCNVLSLDQTDHNIDRLTDYGAFYSLSDEESAALVLLCTLLDPVTLNDVCIFHDEEACGDSTNQFFEINARRATLAAAESVMIGNVKVAVKKIMCYKMQWLEYCYIEPLAHFIDLYQNASRRQQTQLAYYDDSSDTDEDEKCCCTIL